MVSPAGTGGNPNTKSTSVGRIVATGPSVVLGMPLASEMHTTVLTVMQA